jgi:hypothetical protein
VPEEALANATPYLQAFGHVVLAWTVAGRGAGLQRRPSPTRRGRCAAMRYFFAYELPKIDAWLAVVASRDATVPRRCATAGSDGHERGKKSRDLVWVLIYSGLLSAALGCS